MPALPLFRPREVVRAFERLGWQVARQHGSHIVLDEGGEEHEMEIVKKTLRLPEQPQK
ncbi:MAG: type II toxin-antitoxin system HicA family toxin [Bryobacteraceae bacterium]|jgi:predicted RNA binding protein YcfA (HicA-like mRNA interferase family)